MRDFWHGIIVTLCVLLLAAALLGCAHSSANEVFYDAALDWCDERGTCSVGKTAWK